MQHSHEWHEFESLHFEACEELKHVMGSRLVIRLKGERLQSLEASERRSCKEQLRLLS